MLKLIKEKVLKNLPHITWNQFFSKLPYDGLIDNKSVINDNEPIQIIVFNREVIEVLESGYNKIERNHFNNFLNELQNKMKDYTFRYEYKTENNMVKTNLYVSYNNKTIKIVFNHNLNEYTIYYVSNNMIKKDSNRVNIFGISRTAFMNEVENNIKSCIKLSDDNITDIDSYVDDNFNNVMNGILKNIVDKYLYYENNENRYQIIDRMFLKIIYDKNSRVFKFEYYPIDGNNEIKFVFDFKTVEEFTDKYNQTFKDLVEADIIKKPEQYVDYMNKYFPIKIEL